MRAVIRNHSLSLVMFGLFLFALAGHALSGWSVFNEEQATHGSSSVGLLPYLATGHFTATLMENWESEFLQMGLFVLLTVWLRQKGSPESKPVRGEEEVDRKPDPKRRGAPWPVRVGGAIGTVYENSLSIALLGLFAVTFAAHVATGATAYSAEQEAHGGAHVSALEYLGTAQLWFESFQNWQSEFMSIGALAVLSIFLRQRGSPESKPVDAPNSKTGT